MVPLILRSLDDHNIYLVYLDSLCMQEVQLLPLFAGSDNFCLCFTNFLLADCELSSEMDIEWSICDVRDGQQIEFHLRCVYNIH